MGATGEERQSSHMGAPPRGPTQKQEWRFPGGKTGMAISVGVALAAGAHFIGQEIPNPLKLFSPGYWAHQAADTGLSGLETIYSGEEVLLESETSEGFMVLPQGAEMPETPEKTWGVLVRHDKAGDVVSPFKVKAEGEAKYSLVEGVDTKTYTDASGMPENVPDGSFAVLVYPKGSTMPDSAPTRADFGEVSELIVSLTETGTKVTEPAPTPERTTPRVPETPRERDPHMPTREERGARLRGEMRERSTGPGSATEEGTRPKTEPSGDTGRIITRTREPHPPRTREPSSRLGGRRPVKEPRESEPSPTTAEPTTESEVPEPMRAGVDLSEFTRRGTHQLWEFYIGRDRHIGIVSPKRDDGLIYFREAMDPSTTRLTPLADYVIDTPKPESVVLDNKAYGIIPQQVKSARKLYIADTYSDPSRKPEVIPMAPGTAGRMAESYSDRARNLEISNDGLRDLADRLRERQEIRERTPQRGKRPRGRTHN